MKYLFATALCITSLMSFAEPVCNVQVCNRIERFSLDPWSHIKDSMAEVCFDIILPENESVVGKVLTNESRWYQGSTINPTKRSVTKVKQVYKCFNTKEKTNDNN